MSVHTPAPWPVAGRVAIAIILGSAVVAVRTEEKREAEAIVTQHEIKPAREPAVKAWI